LSIVWDWTSGTLTGNHTIVETFTPVLGVIYVEIGPFLTTGAALTTGTA